MNIRTEQVEALLRQQELQARKSPSPAGDGFGAALAQQMALDGTEKNVKTPPPLPGGQSGVIGQMLLAGVEKNSTVEPVAQATNNALDQASGALDTWDSYVAVLRKPGAEGNLREAYGLLEDLDAQVASLKQGAGPLLGQNPNLAGLVNELEVLTATEKFKFNRGDYV